ncbi:Dicer [Ganoderma sinense ZZ0214-1]|uniref:Dicer n=1 Tax=Ganoderma sinense ZZ0214-1 TaxID=1077348 RepID=A0A2G8SSK4_9APHY|nr:Dicer [Ganoderma sinense ZZ0214-1]
MNVVAGPPPKKRKTTSPLLSGTNGLPRPMITSEDIFAQLEQGNGDYLTFLRAGFVDLVVLSVIAVVENHEEKMSLLQQALGQCTVAQQSMSANGPRSHRVVLFIVDDNQSIGQYSKELEELDFSVGSYTVSMHSSGVNRWPDVIYNDIVVVAANMLLDSLSDGSLKLSQAHLLVVSDAQRVVPMVTPHPVLRMMTDFYGKTPEIPKLLALLTSSSDRWASLDLAWLEIPWRAQSFFLATKTADSWVGPIELVMEFDSSAPAPSEPSMSAVVRKADPEGLLVRPRHYRRARRVFAQLGSFAANAWWRDTLEKLLAAPTSSEGKAALVQAGLGIVKDHGAMDKLQITLNSPVSNVTPKFSKLLQVLQPCSSYGDHFRGILFVQDRVVAQALPGLLQATESQLPFIRAFAPNCKVKSGSDSSLGSRSFDLFDDQLSYAYSHLHSRGQHSHIVHMVERGNNEQRRILIRLQNVDSELRAWMVSLAHGSHDAPPKSIHVGLNSYQSDSEGEDEDHVVDAVTSARLDRSTAVPALYRFAVQIHALPGAEDEKVSLSLETEEREGAPAFRYIVSFPRCTMLQIFTGGFCSTPWEARRDACYQACKKLIRVGIMDHRCFPQSQRFPQDHSSSVGTNSVASQDVKTANTSATTHGYPRKFPDFWKNTQSEPATTLYPTVVAPDNMGGDVHSPILLLARAPIPHIPEFTLFFSGLRTTIRFFQAAPIEVTEPRLKALHEYTLRVARSLTNKPLECPPESLLCYFAPLDSSWHSNLSAHWPLLSVEEHILWDAVQLAADYFAIGLLDGNVSVDDRANDAIVLDRQVEFTMRYYVVKVRHDLTPLSKADDSPREDGYDNFLEYCKARCKEFQGLEDVNQPMIEVNVVPGIVNNLHPTSAPPTPPAKLPLKYLIPELCQKFTIPASTFRTLWLIPSIMTKLESYLLVKELNARLFENTVLEQQLLTALSTPAAYTEINYERLEFLGDSFLKVVASNFYYATMPASGAGDLHHARKSLIANRVLPEGATHAGVPSYIQHKRFVAKLWHPPMATANRVAQQVKCKDVDGNAEMKTDPTEKKDKGKRSKKQRQLDEQNTIWMGEKVSAHHRNEKVIADVVEAILAAAFLSGGHEVALQAARKVRLPIPNIAQWSDYARLAAERAAQAQPATMRALPPSTSVEAIEIILGSKFNRPELLGQALSAMVSNETLAAFCVHVGLQQYIHMESKELTAAIQKYMDFLGELRKKEYDFAERENRLPGQYWLDMPMEPPKCLSDVVESLIGALYVSDNFFEMGVGHFFETVFKPFLEAHVRLQTLSANPKITLLELLQAEGCQNNAVVKRPQTRQNMPVEMDVFIHGKIIASAIDSSAVIATRKVSLAALDTLTHDPELLARMCDCRSSTSSSTKGQGAKVPVAKGDTSLEEETEVAEIEAAMEAHGGSTD